MLYTAYVFLERILDKPRKILTFLYFKDKIFITAENLDNKKKNIPAKQFLCFHKCFRTQPCIEQNTVTRFYLLLIDKSLIINIPSLKARTMLPSFLYEFLVTGDKCPQDWKTQPREKKKVARPNEVLGWYESKKKVPQS